MNSPGEFSFSNSVATAYDEVLVPSLFLPWAERLAREHGPWAGMQVLDLATGTGIVAQLLAEVVGDKGTILAADISPDMLAEARKRCSDSAGRVEFRRSPAHPLEVDDASVDVITCQQGFQFFPDRAAAAAEMHRALRMGGRVVVSCWLPTDRCELFGTICDALNEIGEDEIADNMRKPFDYMPGNEMLQHFQAAGFEGAKLAEQEMPLILEGGIEAGVAFAYATPIGPQLSELGDETQRAFQSTLARHLEALSADGKSMGNMATSIVTAKK